MTVDSLLHTFSSDPSYLEAMVSPALEAMSPTNSLIRRIRRADAISKFRARHDGYAWLFGQIHVKHLLLVTHVVFLIISLWLMWQVGVADFTGLQIPGLDGFSPFDLHHQFQFDHAQEWESIYVSTSPNIQKPYLNISRSVSSALSYLFFISALMGFMVLSAMHGTWQRGVLASLFRINLAFFLIPLLFCVVTLGAGFLLCCIRSFRIQLHQISESRTDQAVTFLIIDSIRFTFLPCALMWIVYLYYVYGCVLSFLYVYRHSWDWSSLKRDIAATSTTSWSFKDRCSSSARLGDHANTRNDLLSRLNGANSSLLSLKVTENPILKSYTKKIEDGRSPSVSVDDIDISFGSETGCENNNMSQSFLFNNSHRHLDTVHEENESQENTPLPSEISSVADVPTRM